jgi:hypothetical protein
MFSKLIPAAVATLGLGLGAMGVSVPAKAGVVVEVGLPGIAVGGGFGPYWYGRPYYREYAPRGFAFRGYRGYGYYGHGYRGRR